MHIVYELSSGSKQKPLNFQQHKNGRQDIAGHNAKWAILGLKQYDFKVNSLIMICFILDL